MYTLMAVLALWAVILLVSPVVAHAQQIAPTKGTQDAINEGVERIVVSPGDSLWTITSERLGPNASPQHVANGVERIYALNRNRIGDPDLIFPGQKLLLPPTAQLAAEATPAQKATKPAEASPTDRATESGTNQTSRTIVREDNDKNDPVPEPEAESATLPDEVASATVPAVRPLVANESPSSLAEARADQYRRLGLGILLLTGVVPILGAWARRWAVRRKARMRELRFQEEYGSYYTAHDFFANHKDVPRLASEMQGSTVPTGGSRNGGIMSENHSAAVGLLAIAQAKRERIRRKQALGLERLSRRYPAADIQVSKVSSSLRRQSPSLLQRRLLHGRRRAATATVVAAAKRSHSLHEEWEPSVALRNTLEEIPLQPGAGHRGDASRLKPHLEEAVRTLTRIER